MSMPDRPPPHAAGLKLWQEITLVLVVKLIALYVIWLAFFSEPTGRRLDAGGVASSLLNASSAPAKNGNPPEANRAARPGTR